MNTRYIPQDAQEVTRLDLPGVVYTYTHAATGQLCAVAYAGKSNKPTWHYRFMNAAQREHRIDAFFDGIAQRQDFMTARKSERSAFTHTLKPGDILYASWGYDQTNIDFYQVTATTKKTVTFRELKQIAHRDGMYSDGGLTVPDRDNFRDSKEHTRTVKPGNCVNFAEYDGGYMRHLSPWDGRPEHWSDGH